MGLFLHSRWPDLCAQFQAVGEDGQVPSFEAFVTHDDGLEVSGQLSIAELADQYRVRDNEPMEEASDDDAEGENPRHVSGAEALEAVETLRHYAHQQEHQHEELSNMITQIENLVISCPRKNRQKFQISSVKFEMYLVLHTHLLFASLVTSPLNCQKEY